MGRKSAKGKFYNDFFYKDEPCSLEWYKLWKDKQSSSMEQDIQRINSDPRGAYYDTKK
jgi:hypothetical protein